MRRTLVAALLIPCAALAWGVATASSLAGLITAIVGVSVLTWAWFAVGRNFRSWGYVEREDDLLVTHGAMFKKLTVVPYGRMQLVDVTAGAAERLFGLSTIKLHTAAATTDARIPGLRPEEATRLRDRLAALGEAQAAGV